MSLDGSRDDVSSVYISCPMEAGEMRVCVQCTELPTTGCLQVMPHSSLKSLACWLSTFFLRLAVSRVPLFSQWCHSREENGRVQYRDERYSSSGRRSTVLWNTMNFLAQVRKADERRETPLTEHVYLDSPESFAPTSTPSWSLEQQIQHKLFQ